MAKFCSNCGKEIADGADICLSCGKMINDTKVNVNINNGNSSNKPAKSKVAAGILGIFFGSLGVHNFYLGYSGKGIAQLLITILTCGFGAIVTSVWGLIEAIMILTGSINVDANGNPLE